MKQTMKTKRNDLKEILLSTFNKKNVNSGETLYILMKEYFITSILIDQQPVTASYTIN